MTGTSLAATLAVSRAGTWRAWLIGVSGAVGAAVAAEAASRVDMPIGSDYGLVAVLPATFWVGMAVVNLMLALALRDAEPRAPLLLGLQLLLIGVVYGTPALISDVPRTEVSWRHLGIAGELIGSGRIDPSIDAYFNWPGFFAGLASFLELTGVPPERAALLAPVVNGALWAAGVAVVVRTLTGDRRHMWLAMWFFTLTNWIDQDYLSPQAFAFFLYLVVVALLLSCLAARPTVRLRAAVTDRGLRRGTFAWWLQRIPVEPDRRRRIAGLWLAVLLSVVIIVSHQLTPFMLLGAVILLTLTGRCWSVSLTAILGVVIALWLTTAASSYLAGHPVLFASSLGDTAQAGLLQRVDGSPGHERVGQVRTGLTLVMMALAVLGGLRMFRRRQRDLRPALLAAFPFAMIPVQSYGGEMLMRSTLFALPFLAYFAAGLFLPAGNRDAPRFTPWLVALTLPLAGALVTARFGNTAFDMFTRNEVEGTRVLYRLAPPNALLIGGARPTPWRFRDYAEFKTRTVSEICRAPMTLAKCYDLVRGQAVSNSAGALVLLTRANRESVRMQGDLGGNSLDGFERVLVRRDEAQLVYLNPDVRIYQFPPQKKSSP